MATEPPAQVADALLGRIRACREDMIALLRRLAEAETPSDDPAAQRPVQDLLRGELEREGFKVRRVRGRGTGGLLYARPRLRPRGRPLQLLLGHSDTVWPIGTVRTMPVRLEGGRLYGPGTFDMKGGLVQAVFALRTLRELGFEMPAVPVMVVNADEEVGSPESKRWIRTLARLACRCWVLEPALGPDGRLKTARKGAGRFTIRVRGRAAHAGLDPGAGASAVSELARVIRVLDDLADPGRGSTVNVGVVQGGTRANVVAAEARAEVDVRALDAEEAARVEARIRGLEPGTPGVTVEAEGGFHAPPLERTPRNRRLWMAAVAAGRELGLHLEEGTAGGASDGNTTSRWTPTLDGLGPVGDGAHAAHEHVDVDAWVERCALLARLLLWPVEPSPTEGRGPVDRRPTAVGPDHDA